MQPEDPALRRLIDQIRTAHDDQSALDIRGGGTKAFYGGQPRGDVLDMTSLAGISSHEPTELVVTVRAGTLLAELEAALREHGQCLAFEPPRFGPHGTVGGMVAAGLAGPARVAVGGLRDHVLGATLLNGRGELMSFGGQVMKNVAGYDISRLLAGSMGVLGVICELSLKVLPLPMASSTLEFELDQAEALAWFNTMRARPLPLTASSWHDGRLRLRLSGAQAAVASAERQLGGRQMEAMEAMDWWLALRDQRMRFFHLDAADLARGESIWRLSMPATAPKLTTPGDCLLEWSGAQRWQRSSASAAQVRAAAAAHGGHATLFRSADKSAGVFTPLPAALMRIHRELKVAFDPAGILNPGRLYADF